MQADPITEWQRLTELYREMNDGELEALDANKADLTEVAQQVLSDEVKKRGLNEPRGAEEGTIQPGSFAAPIDGVDSPTADGSTEESEPPVEYTWKTMLCECEDQEEAWQIREVLRGAGIESWIDRPGYYVAPGIGNLQIMVAADQIEKAHEITSRPIPQEIVEQSKMDIPDYEPPVCPSCGAADPVLEGADPVNSWRCESCGKQWTDAAEDAKESTALQSSTHKASEEENPFAPGPLTIL
jgi:ribosomal protein L37AE/L43A